MKRLITGILMFIGLIGFFLWSAITEQGIIEPHWIGNSAISAVIWTVFIIAVLSFYYGLQSLNSNSVKK